MSISAKGDLAAYLQSRYRLCALTSSQRRAAGRGGCAVTSASRSLPGLRIPPRQPKICRDQNLRVPSQKASGTWQKGAARLHLPRASAPGDEGSPSKHPPGTQGLPRPPAFPAEKAGIPLPGAAESRERAPTALACPCRVISAWSYLGWALAPGEECVPMGQVVRLSCGML